MVDKKTQLLADFYTACLEKATPICVTLRKVSRQR